jgi:hypothetical protein
MTDPDGIKTTTELDELGRVIHVTIGGAALHPEEWFAYDGRGFARAQCVSSGRESCGAPLHL